MTRVIRHEMIIPVSDEMLAEARAFREAADRWAAATPEQREQWAREQEAERNAERDTATHVPLTLDALLDKLGFSHAYAEHLVQPYCGCYDGRDGWEYCPHARDEGLVP